VIAGGTSQNFFFKDSTIETVTPAADDAANTLTGAIISVSVIGQGGAITFDLDGSPVDHSTNSHAHVELATNILALWGDDAAGNFFQLFAPAQAGTYPCDFGVSMYYQNSGSAQWGGYSGFGSCSVTIASIGSLGETVSGSFSGNLIGQFGGAVGSRNIANGQFSLIRGLP
jgi:hypothetical protein